MTGICKADYDLRVTARKQAEESLETARKQKLQTDIKLPEIGYHDIYDVRFSGLLCNDIRRIARDQFGRELHNMMHVYVDQQPDQISDGIHPITVYGFACLLYKWKPQGYHRGLVVLVNDELGNAVAEIYRESNTWSWMLPDEFKIRIQRISK